MVSVEKPVQETVDYLSSKAARDALRLDPYWPKWDSPWWRMTLLWEMGLAARVPQSAVETMVSMLNLHYVQAFPVEPGKLPAGWDARLRVLCPCAIGTIYQVLQACGVPVDSELPWLKAALLSAQLPDGGLNCEENAYAGSRKSSIVSTLPALEAVLHASKSYSEQEAAFLDRGAQYLIFHRLTRSTRGELIDASWHRLCFPRFYDYDILRGLTFLAAWRKRRGRPVPAHAIWEATEQLSEKPLIVERDALAKDSLLWNGKAWGKGPARRFALLDEVSRLGVVSPYLRLPA